MASIEGPVPECVQLKADNQGEWSQWRFFSHVAGETESVARLAWELAGLSMGWIWRRDCSDLFGGSLCCAKVQTVKADGQRKNGGAVKSARRLLPGQAVEDGYTRHPFDLEFGVRTSGLIAGRHLKSGHRHDRHNTAYYGVAPSVFQAMIVRWRRSRPVAPIDEFTFVDLGAGMGRAVLLASELPFKAVVGVELHPGLARIARRNMAAWRAAGRAAGPFGKLRAGSALAPMRMVCGDATEFRWPAGPCVAFLFNPFGAAVMRRVLAALAKGFAGRAGELDLLYVNNEQERVLERQAGFARVFQGEVRRSRADAIADHKILANQPDGEYASFHWEDCSIWRWGG
jgi:SAM-dependent methyltransferase